MNLIKKFNLENKIQSKNIDVVKHFKYYIIAPIVILIASIIMLCTIGFNKSIDFTGGYVLKVYLGDAFSVEQAEEKIDHTLAEHNLSASLYQKTEDESKKYITVKYKVDQSMTSLELSEMNGQIVDELFASFGYDKEDLQEKSYIGDAQKIDSSIGEQALVTVFGAIVLSSVLALIYLIVRYGHRSAMTALLCVYHDILIALGLAVIFRIELNMTFVSALVAILVYSFINTTLYFAKVKENEENEKRAKVLANKSIKDYLGFEIMITWLLLIMLILFSIIGVKTILPFTLITIFGVLASFFSTTFIAPALFAFIYVPKKKKIKQETSKEVV